MENAARRYITRVLVSHLVFLALVLGVVALAGRALYASAQGEAEATALGRLNAAANQTAGAIERHFAGIFDTLSFANRARPTNALLRGGREGEAVGAALWAQLRGRASDLLVFDAAADGASPSLALREHFANRPPRLDAAAASTLPAMPLPVPPELYSPMPDSAGADGLLASAEDWLRGVLASREPAVSPPFWITAAPGDAKATKTPVLLAAVPLGRAEAVQGDAATRRVRATPLLPPRDDSGGVESLLVAVLPVAAVQQSFLLPAAEPGVQGMLLFDAKAELIAGGGDDLVGRSAASLAPGALATGLSQYVVGLTLGDTSQSRDFGPVKLGDLDFARTIAVGRSLRTTARPAVAAPGGVSNALGGAAAAAAASADGGPRNKSRFPAQSRFWLVGVLDHDSVVKPLEETTQTATLWAGAVVVAMSTILVSSAVQLIRGRNRLERLRTEMIDKELDDARRIQLMWLPDDEVHETETRQIDIAAENVPASRISGDFYNYFDLPDGRCALVIGDVTGHGMAAAFLMATTQLLIKTTLQRVIDPGKTLEEVNNLLCTQAFGGQFVTIQLIVVDPRTETLKIASAGHPPPLTCEPGGVWRPLDVDAQLVLGVMEGSEYPTQTLPLPRCNAMLLYTDGLIEAKNRADERFSEEQLCDWLGRRVGSEVESAKQLAEETLGIVHDFSGGTVLEDDLTLLAVHLVPTRRRGAAPAADNPLESVAAASED